MNTIAERLIYARKLRKWSRAQAAAAAGISPSTISNIELGIRDGRPSLPAIAQALGISERWLAEDEGEMVLPVGHDRQQLSHEAHQLGRALDDLKDERLKRVMYAHLVIALSDPARFLSSVRTSQEHPLPGGKLPE